MSEGFFSRGFFGRRRSHDERLPPGQYLEHGFPVLSAGRCRAGRGTSQASTWTFASPRRTVTRPSAATR
jgi:hypothetical protein